MISGPSLIIRGVYNDDALGLPGELFTEASLLDGASTLKVSSSLTKVSLSLELARLNTDP